MSVDAEDHVGLKDFCCLIMGPGVVKKGMPVPPSDKGQCLLGPHMAIRDHHQPELDNRQQ